MKGTHIGDLEELVLLSVGSLYREAYAVNIMKVIKENSTRSPDVTSVHSVLRRLEKKGLVNSEMGGASAERGGRRKRLFTLTTAGRAVLDDINATRTALYSRLPKLTMQGISI